MESNVIRIADEPVQINGRYHIHLSKAAESDAAVQMSHFPDDEDSWVDLDEESIASAVVELAGYLRVTGTDETAKLSYIRLRV